MPKTINIASVQLKELRGFERCAIHAPIVDIVRPWVDSKIHGVIASEHHVDFVSIVVDLVERYNRIVSYGIISLITSAATTAIPPSSGAIIGRVDDVVEGCWQDYYDDIDSLVEGTSIDSADAEESEAVLSFLYSCADEIYSVGESVIKGVIKDNMASWALCLHDVHSELYVASQRHHILAYLSDVEGLYGGNGFVDQMVTGIVRYPSPKFTWRAGARNADKIQKFIRERLGTTAMWTDELIITVNGEVADPASVVVQQGDQVYGYLVSECRE